MREAAFPLNAIQLHLPRKIVGVGSGARTRTALRPTDFKSHIDVMLRWSERGRELINCSSALCYDGCLWRR